MPHKKKADSTKKLFRDPSGQQDFIEKSYEEELEAKRNQPVECLGKKFPNDDARREYFLGELAKKLKDPEFRKIEGFPIGEDEDILALSDPPYYTACPNPWPGDLIAGWEKTKPKQSRPKRSDEPFAVDVSEGKGDPLYNLHSYHTKVPPQAILKYILHYTMPGDIILDGFCGTGMTGVAASLASSPSPELKDKTDREFLLRGAAKPRWGERKVFLADLSPAATFIASSLNGSASRISLQTERTLDLANTELDWMYLTKHTQGSYGEIAYTVWSDVLACPECQHHFVFWDNAVDLTKRKVLPRFSCPHCGADICKKVCHKVKHTVYDEVLQTSVSQIKHEPVRIAYYLGKKKHFKMPDAEDRATLKRISSYSLGDWIPCQEMPQGERYLKDAFHLIGFSHVHHFFMKRSLIAISRLGGLLKDSGDRTGRLVLNSITGRLVSNIVGYQMEKRGNVPMSGTLYVPSLIAEANVFRAFKSKAETFRRSLRPARKYCATSTGSSSALTSVPDNTIDYIFIDPPFGNNLSYSELNIFWESWLGVCTANDTEAVMDKGHSKGIAEYHALLHSCMKEFFRVLKDGRWITVEFHNSKNAIWNVIQESLQRAGFVIADVRILDKQGDTYKQSQQGLVKADLVISAYKPTHELESTFAVEAGTEQGAWDFIRDHLSKLPTFVSTSDQAGVLPERMAYMLFDRMVAFHVQRGVGVPLSAAEFFRGLDSRFPLRDQMYFLPEQVNSYEKERSRFNSIAQFELFIQDEESAIAWLKQQLLIKPQSFQDIHPKFTKETSGWLRHEKPSELRQLLEENFLCYEGAGPVPSQIHSYLSTNWKEYRSKDKCDPRLQEKAKGRWYVADTRKAEDLELIRDKALLREFWEYMPDGHKPQIKPDFQDELPGLAITKVKNPTGKRMKVIRTEAVRTGFKYCWQNQDYRTIIAVAKRIPEDVLQEDPKLLMWYDQALTRLGEE